WLHIRCYCFSNAALGLTKSIGINRLARQILCKTHKSALPETDFEAKKTACIFQCSTPPAKDEPLAYNDVDVQKLEQCLLKTAINLSLGDQLHSVSACLVLCPASASLYLIDVALGKSQFSPTLGAVIVIR
ncbi:hypothetical protein, partial [Aquabacterium sp.]|uniref:hypothetical protein n=1 Tax=Aquabacterium sp. TaxID=1872578 RepID=UPI004037786D